MSEKASAGNEENAEARDACLPSVGDIVSRTRRRILASHRIGAQDNDRVEKMTITKDEDDKTGVGNEKYNKETLVYEWKYASSVQFYEKSYKVLGQREGASNGRMKDQPSCP